MIVAEVTPVFEARGSAGIEVADHRGELGLATRRAAFSGANHFARRWPVSGYCWSISRTSSGKTRTTQGTERPGPSTLR